jgi:hypothetical protein
VACKALCGSEVFGSVETMSDAEEPDPLHTNGYGERTAYDNPLGEVDAVWREGRTETWAG